MRQERQKVMQATPMGWVHLSARPGNGKDVGKLAPMVEGTKDVAALARAIAREDPGRAERMIRGLPDAFTKAWSAADIAAELLTDEPEWARRFADVVASRERHGDRTLLAISSQALARALAGSSWLDALPAVALLAPEDMRTICRAVADRADEDASRIATA